MRKDHLSTFLLKKLLLGLILFTSISFKTHAQCTVGATYASAGSGYKELVSINTTTGASTVVVANLFGGGNAASDGQKETTAIALDIDNNVIWFCNRGSSVSPRIYSYNLNTMTYGTTTASFSGISSTGNVNKAGYNPVDKKIYFQNANNNHIYSFNPATPTVAAVDLGTLSITSPTTINTVNDFSGGDIAFDGVGNMVGVFYNSTTSTGIIGSFLANYDGSGNYLGVDFSNGQKISNASISAPASVAFYSDGNLYVGSTAGIQKVNSSTGAVINNSFSAYSNADMGSCVAPVPNLVVQNSGSVNCVAGTASFTLTVQNTGNFHAFNAMLIDATPAGLTLSSATLNGVAIPAATLANIGTTGIPVKSTGATTSGQILKGETATVVLNYTKGSALYTPVQNQAFVKYNGIQQLGVPGNQLASDDPITVAPDDATIVSCTSVLTANNDTFGNSGGNVIANDQLNGVAATTATTDVTPTTNGPLSVDADGNVTVAPGTPTGSYTLTYEICESGASPENCKNATATVNVSNTLTASNDTFGASGGNVLGNDQLNGVAVTTSNTDVTPSTNGPLSIDADGNVTVAPGTPTGTYTINYTICETGASPANCKNATATVNVSNTLTASNDTFGSIGGSVLGNDLINGVPVTTSNTDVTPATDGPLSIDADGNVTVAPGTPSGTYTITYTICETGASPANCKTAVATVNVTTPIVANDDDFSTTPISAGSSTSSVNNK